MPESTQKHWDKYWKKREKMMLNRYYHEKPVNAINNLFPDIKNKKILELGAGSGVDIAQFSKMGANAYVIDYSQKSLEMVKKVSKKENVEINLVKADASVLPFKNNSLDAVYSLGLIEHFKDPIPIIREQKRVLKKHGLILVDSPQTFTVHTLKKHILMHFDKYISGWETQYTIKQLIQMLKSQNFKIVSTYARSYDFRPLLIIRQLHKIGIGFMGKETIYPILPPKIGRIYNQIWNWFENLKIAYYMCWCIAVIGEKVE